MLLKNDIVADIRKWWQKAAAKRKEVQIQKAKGREDFGKSEKLRVRREKRSIKRRGQRTRNGTGTTEPDVGRPPTSRTQGPQYCGPASGPLGCQGSLAGGGSQAY